MKKDVRNLIISVLCLVCLIVAALLVGFGFKYDRRIMAVGIIMGIISILVAKKI